jgi:hypothetical protein
MIKPMENVLLQEKCQFKKKEGILLVTTARVLFKSEN